MAVTTTQTRSTARADETWQKNATYPERPDELDRGLPLESWLNHSMSFRRSIEFIGPHGTGKTSAVKAFFKDRGIRVIYLNLANIAPGDKLASAMVRRADGTVALSQMLTEDLAQDEPFALILDDSHHAAPKVLNTFMQVVNNWTLGQFDLGANCVAVVLLNNEGNAEGIRHGFDPAQADRKVTVVMHHNDTGWRYALARKYATNDLSRAFRVWDSLTPDLRHVLSPRALDHVIYCAINGLPAIYGLPLMGDQRQLLVSAASAADSTPVDRTEEILTSICRALGVPYLTDVADKVEKILALTMRDRLTVHFQGPPGCGKTEVTKSTVKAAGMDDIYFSMPVTEPEMLQVPMPTGESTMKSLLDQRFLSDKPYVIIWDEYNRPQSNSAFACLMEATQEYSIAGIPLENCRGQIALSNPSEWMGLRMQVAKNNIAQADRFTIAVQVTPDDIKANAWLLTVWPTLPTVTRGDEGRTPQARAVMEAVLDWHKEDLGDEHKEWISKRTIQRLAELHLDGLPLENAKIYIGNGEFAPVPLVDLEGRLASKQITRLREIAANVEEWVERLKVASEVSDEGTNDSDMVHQALTLAEVPQLWANFEAVARLLAQLPAKYKTTYLVGVTDMSRQKFFCDALAVAYNRKKLSEIEFPDGVRRM